MGEPVSSQGASGATDANASQIADTYAEEHHLSEGEASGKEQSIKDGSDESEDMDAETQLQFLATSMRDQDDLERDIGRQADQMLREQEDERDKKRKEKTEREKEKWQSEIRRLRQKLAQPANSTIKNKIRADIETAELRLKGAEQELLQIQARVDERQRVAEEAAETQQDAGKSGPLPGEGRRDFLLRTGKITPFSTVPNVSSKKKTPMISDNLADVMLDAEEDDDAEYPDDDDVDANIQTDGWKQNGMSHRNLKKPGFMDDFGETSSATDTTPPKKRRLQAKAAVKRRASSSSEFSDFIDDDEDEEFVETPRSSKKARSKKSKASETDDEIEDNVDLTGKDDGNEQVYQSRLQQWTKKRSEARRRTQDSNAPEPDDAEEWNLPHPTQPDAELDGGFKVPGDIHPYLFDYQKTGVQWLWQLYTQQVGGIVGDEMGLGKTVQIVSFIAGLHYSKMLTKPVIIVCPATLMRQWVDEFHRWWPALRVSILHTSGSGMMNLRDERKMERELEYDEYSSKKNSKSHKGAKKIVGRVVKDGHILVTTYSGLQSYAEYLLPIEWGYAVLDEGHKIRNPNAGITIYCKGLQTHNRIILSGTPMQNNLIELWSLFDFVFPMRLGTLVTFRQQFEFPIKQGGYANASNLAVETAMRCAEALKETISPYLLQRFKVDVAADLPKKTERVLFCKLTKIQRKAYEDFLRSDDMAAIMSGKRQALYGVDILRKISNHPDLVGHKTLSKKPGTDYGKATKSGKMQVVKALLEIWKKDGHKVLLFCQHKIMLDIIEKFVKSLPGFNYLRMDGDTPIKTRQTLVDEFNQNNDIHVFLLTTKVGGLGVNLTGADRVLIYDPDWNPSTDVQARERAWRLGQKREVEIYRLMTAGTIEEKIYHRQIFKQFLTNKILKDPKQRQTFALRDLQDLFTLGEEQPEGQTETGTLFQGTEVNFNKGKKPNGEEDGNKDPVQGKPLKESTASAPSPVATLDVAGLSRQEDYKTGADEEAAAESKDDRIMSALFSRSGVHSALEHDAILASNSRKPKVQADPAIITREAKRIAAEAAEQLRQSGEIARAIPAGQATWTGQFGTSGRPEERPRGAGRGGFSARGGRGGGPSSSGVLSNLAARQGTSSRSARGGRNAAQEANLPEGKELFGMMREYFLAHGGTVYTQNLIDHFDRYCKTDRRVAQFKEMLAELADMVKGRSGGRARWILKREWRNDGNSSTASNAGSRTGSATPSRAVPRSGFRAGSSRGH